MKLVWILRISISLLAIIVALVHHFYGILTNDTLTWVLLAIAVLPWAYSVVEEVAGPGGWKVRFREISDQQEKFMDMIVTFSMSGFIYGTLQRICFAQRSHSEKLYDPEHEAEHLRFLHEHGYINFIDLDALSKGDDLAKRIVVTPAGKYYVQIREKTEAEEEKQKA